MTVSSMITAGGSGTVSVTGVEVMQQGIITASECQNNTDITSSGGDVEVIGQGGGTLGQQIILEFPGNESSIAAVFW